MNKKEIFAHFSSILDDMLYDSLFFKTFWQAPSDEEDMCGSIDDRALPENISINFGATRGCIIDDDYNYVVKFDTNSDLNGPACEREEYLYKAARDNNLEQYFAECIYLGTYVKNILFYDYNKIERYVRWYGYDWREFEKNFMLNEDKFGDLHNITITIPLYAYPKARQHYYREGTKEDITRAKSITSPMRDSNLAVAIDFVRYYGVEEYQRISNFMYDEDINDLHLANCGEINGHFCIIDYSGYYDPFSCYDQDSTLEI